MADDDVPAEVAGQLKEAMAGHRRISLIVSDAPRETAVRALRILVPQGAVTQHRFIGVKVLLYEIPPHLGESR